MDESMIEFQSIFYEVATETDIKSYEEQLKVLKGMKKDEAPQKVLRALAIYFKICGISNVISGVIIPPFLISAWIDFYITKALNNKTKKGSLKNLKSDVDKDIRKIDKQLKKTDDKKTRSNLEKNRDALAKISDQLATAINNA